LGERQEEEDARISRLKREAAPELYDALVACVGLLNAFIGPDDTLGMAHIKAANAAIAMARGEVA
jgi:hypothetical protein